MTARWPVRGLVLWMLLSEPGQGQEVSLVELQQRASSGELEQVVAILRSMPEPSTGALRLWAWLESCAGRQESALTILDQLLARDPADRDARKRRADAWWAQGRFQAARTEYQALSESEADAGQREHLRDSLARLVALSHDQRDLRASMHRLQRWYWISVLAAGVFLLWGVAASMRLWLRG